MKKEWNFIKSEIFGDEKPSIPIGGMHLFKRDFLMILQTTLAKEDKFDFYKDLKKNIKKCQKNKNH